MAILSEKTKLFIKGRKGLIPSIRESLKEVSNPIVWVHSPSYGEFEEVRPVITSMRQRCPEYKFLVTFFSPSGYEPLKNDPIADWVFYMPIDTPRNASAFLDAVHPTKVIFAIADFWLFFLKELKKRKIETYLVSGRFQEGMSYFKPVGRPYIKAFRESFTKLIVNTEESVRVLKAHGVDNCVVFGDPRMDRVLDIASQAWSDPIIDQWCEGRKVFVGGSTLPGEDDEMMIALANAYPEDKFLIVPHESGKEELEYLQLSIKGKTALYSDPDPDAQVLIVNTVGILARSYRYGFAAYVGSGFDGGPHSIIEPASYGIPVAYGPEFGPVWHCQCMIDCGAGISVSTAQEILDWYKTLKDDPQKLEASGKAAREYCEKGRGATEKIIDVII